MVLSVRAAPHEISFAFILPVGEHGNPCIAQRGTIFVDADRIRNRFRASALTVEVNKGTYAAGLEEAVGRQVIHSGIKAHIFNGENRHVMLHFGKSSEEGYRVMPLCTGKTEQERDVCMERRVMAGQLEECKAIIVLIQIAVPAPGGIGIRIMTRGGGKLIR